jgi:hypothetical protein
MSVGPYYSVCEACGTHRPLVLHVDERITTSLTVERRMRALCIPCRDRAATRSRRVA